MNPQFVVYPIPGFSDPVSALTHLVGAAVFAVLGFFLVLRGRGWNRMWLAIFACSAVFCLSMSGVYHMLPLDGFAREQVLRRLDHAAIFVLIAGTFTAAHGILFRGISRWGVIAAFWIGAALAITLKSIYFNSFPAWLGTLLYLAFGWVGLLSGVKLWRNFGVTLIRPLLAGGASYTIGALVDFHAGALWITGVFGPHEFFHLMVLAGLAFHTRFLWRATQINSGQQPVSTRPGVCAIDVP